MDWQKINTKDLEKTEAYRKKYGVNSDFKIAQKIMYSHPEILESFTKALSWMTIKSGYTVLDIGINNGYEINIIKAHYGRDLLNTINFIGIDLIEDSLLEANSTFGCDNFRFIKGDISKFNGIDIASNEIFGIDNNSINVVFALTSIQSTSLMANFSIFISDLASKVKEDGSIFIVIPNCFVNSQNLVTKGQFDAQTQSVSTTSALLFIKKLILELKKYGYKHKQTGELYIFLYFYKAI